MELLTLPLDYAAIQQILPHRYPFLLVDRITELEPDKRIVGIKNVSVSERFLSPATGAAPGLPPPILTECVGKRRRRLARQRRRLFFQLNAVAPALLGTIEGCVRTRNRAERIVLALI